MYGAGSGSYGYSVPQPQHTNNQHAALHYAAPGAMGLRSDSLFRDSGATFVPDPGFSAPPLGQASAGYSRNQPIGQYGM
eukprot:SAG31_NODE_28441_length_410_cov_0.836013_1_plen_78_part_10